MDCIVCWLLSNRLFAMFYLVLQPISQIFKSTHSTDMSVLYKCAFWSYPKSQLPQKCIDKVRSIVMSVSVCLHVCLSVCMSVRLRVSKTTCPNFMKFPLHVTHGRGSILIWRHRNTLCTSGFVYDVMFSIIDPMACGIGNVYLSSVVIDFRRIRQVAPQCLNLSWYTMAANCAPGAFGMMICGALPIVGGLYNQIILL